MTKNSQNTQANVNRGLIMRQMLTVVEAVGINPPDKRRQIIDAINLPNIAVTATDKPVWHVQSKTTDIWRIVKQLKKIPLTDQVLRVSVKFGPRAWLNISGYVDNTSVWKLQSFLFALELVIIVALGFAIWAANHYNSALRRFVSDIEKVSKTIGSITLDEEHGPEAVKQAAVAVNKMQTHVSHLMQTRTQVLAAISHDLRTPLTRLKLRSQFIDDEDSRNKFLKDVDEMEAMIKESLAYSKDEHHQFELTELDLAKVIYRVCQAYQDTGKNVHYSGPKEGFGAVGNELALTRALNNIIDNGLKFGNKINVYLRYLHDHYKIIVDDDGPGIPENEQENVFRPFYRIEKSRSRSTGGTGLGLAAARSIMLAHGGEVNLENNSVGGLRVIIKIGRK